MPSTVIHSFRYDADRSELAIVFQSGRRYIYEAVPKDVAHAMETSFSKGEFFNREIREQYSFRRDDDAEPAADCAPNVEPHRCRNVP